MTFAYNLHTWGYRARREVEIEMEMELELETGKRRTSSEIGQLNTGCRPPLFPEGGQLIRDFFSPPINITFDLISLHRHYVLP